MLDPANPLSNVNLFNTVNRARLLSDDALKSLIPDAQAVTIVRHDAMVDFDATPLNGIRSPIDGSATGCTADLVVANVYVIYPDPKAPYVGSLLGSIVTAVLTGGDRLVIEFWYQRYADGTPTNSVRKKDDRPLPHLRFATSELAEAMTISANVNLAGFATLVATRFAK
ncbi:hypothetical protein DBR17_00645 [Sphingomonas sp. HMWF008]|nr:hypothetical protein DBR17_00645 [Sphingomonas sp. HMWF008]